MKTRIFTFLTLILAFVAKGVAASPELLRADSAYAAKDYARAAELYKHVAETEGTSVGLLFNMGNAYFEEGDYGNAMLCYERAHRLAPSDKKVNSNLRYLSNRVEDANKAEQKGKRFKTSADELSFFQSVHKSMAKDTSSNLWAVLAAAAFVVFVGCVALYIFTRIVVLRKIGFFGGIVMLAASLFFIIFAFMGARAYHSDSEGVLLGFKTELLTEPGASPSNTEKALILTKGTVVQILSEEVDAEGSVTWYKIRLNSDYIGWVPASELERI